MGIKELELRAAAVSRAQEPVAWIVLDETGIADFCAPSAQMCQDHINDAVMSRIDGAEKWKVVSAYTSSNIAEPVNAELVEALEACRARFAYYVEHHLNKGDLVKAAENERYAKLASDALARANLSPCSGHARQQEVEEMEALRKELNSADEMLTAIAELLKEYERRFEFLHRTNIDANGYEWGVYRVKWENGRAVDVLQTRSDLSDLDAAMSETQQAKSGD